jgi:hypothetical protein
MHVGTARRALSRGFEGIHKQETRKFARVVLCRFFAEAWRSLMAHRWEGQIYGRDVVPFGIGAYHPSVKAHNRPVAYTRGCSRWTRLVMRRLTFSASFYVKTKLQQDSAGFDASQTCGEVQKPYMTCRATEGVSPRGSTVVIDSSGSHAIIQRCLQDLSVCSTGR